MRAYADTSFIVALYLQQQSSGKAIAFMETITPQQVDGTEDKEIVLKRGDKEIRYNGMQFLLGQATPNFYFHVTTAYDILRHAGVEIGKRDYIGNP